MQDSQEVPRRAVPNRLQARVKHTDPTGPWGTAPTDSRIVGIGAGGRVGLWPPVTMNHHLYGARGGRFATGCWRPRPKRGQGGTRRHSMLVAFACVYA